MATDTWREGGGRCCVCTCDVCIVVIYCGVWSCMIYIFSYVRMHSVHLDVFKILYVYASIRTIYFLISMSLRIRQKEGERGIMKKANNGTSYEQLTIMATQLTLRREVAEIS